MFAGRDNRVVQADLSCETQRRGAICIYPPGPECFSLSDERETG